MSQMRAERTLFNPLQGTEYIERGGYGHIFTITGTVIAVKIAHRILNGTQAEDERATESLQILHHERAVYEALAAKDSRHPNIVEYFLSTELAIFMRLEPSTVDKRLQCRTEMPIDEGRQFRWILETASAASWLESLGYFHGDMRPDNLLLGPAEHVKLCDFGRTAKEGTRIEVATYPFYRPSKDATAGAAHEQFALGSCAYTIRTGQVPYGEWTTPSEFQDMYDALVCGDFPATDDDRILGHFVASCWRAEFQSMKNAEEALSKVVGLRIEEQKRPGISLLREDHDALVQYCRDFVSRNHVPVV